MKGKELLKLSKAKTIKYLEGKLVNAKILPEYTFTVREFFNNPNKIFNGIDKKINSSKVIVRSSALD